MRVPPFVFGFPFERIPLFTPVRLVLLSPSKLHFRGLHGAYWLFPYWGVEDEDWGNGPSIARFCCLFESPSAHTRTPKSEISILDLLSPFRRHFNGFDAFSRYIFHPSNRGHLSRQTIDYKNQGTLWLSFVSKGWIITGTEKTIIMVNPSFSACF